MSNRVKIKNIKFSNMFSYGEGVEINFDDPVIQLVGPNGAGKSSIPVILEELFFNKNSRGVKKSGIKNRHSSAKSYSCESDFCIGNTSYKLTKVVASTAAVKLFKDGVDISGHTATQTYELVESLLGMEFSTFTKLVYQSMRSNLDFLLATDANRKKFLVSLLGLDHYAEVSSKVKDRASNTKAELISVQNTIKTMEPYVSKQAPTLLELVPEPSFNISALENSVTQLRKQISDLELKEQAYLKNSESKKRLELARNSVPARPLAVAEYEEPASIADLRNNYFSWGSEYKSLSVPATKCPTCGTPYNNAEHAQHVSDRKEELRCLIKSAEPTLNAAKAEKDRVTAAIKDYQSKELAYQKAISTVEALEKSVDTSITTESSANQIAVLTKQLAEIQEEISTAKKMVQQAKDHNQKVEVHNAKVQAELDHINRVVSDISKFKIQNVLIQDRHDKLEVLNKVFGTKGLIAYKIESMTKAFEQLINEYLTVLSNGQFNLIFQVEDTKLALKLYDNGEEVEIESLSSGEFNRVNTSTLLAIRKVMTAMAKVDINVLFLDEVISVLDKEGKDTLISVLLEEQELNSVVVSHGYVHPLAKKLEVYKEGKLSNVK